MHTKALSLLSLLALALLAGCSDAPPSGTIVAGDAGLAVDGTATANYTAFSAPLTIPGSNQPVCPPPQAPPEVPRCTEPSTTITAHFMALPEPDGNGYAIVLNGTAGQKNIGSLVESNGMYDFEYTFPDDYSDDYQAMELRMGDFVFATAPSAAGPQTFALAAGAAGVTATGTFKGKTLDVDVQGLPPGNADYLGRLYERAADGNLTSVREFPIVAGANHFEDEDNDIGDYAEFHIHVGNSKINLFKATIAKK